MSWVDREFKLAIKNVLEHGTVTEQTRAIYAKSRKPAFAKYITHYSVSYNLDEDEFPITQLRPIPWKSAIKEIMWIYQDGSNDLSLLQEKYGVHYWNLWEVGNTGTIGQRYGATVRKYRIIHKLLKGLEENPWNRRNIINLWQYEDFEETEGLLPCAFQVMFDVRKENDKMYLDCALIQRSSDMLVALHINQVQYVALQMMIACHFGWDVGKFTHFVNNLHIYTNQYRKAYALMNRTNRSTEPKLRLTCPKGTNFFDITIDDFVMEDYNPRLPKMKFDLAV